MRQPGSGSEGRGNITWGAKKGVSFGDNKGVQVAWCPLLTGANVDVNMAECGDQEKVQTGHQSENNMEDLTNEGVVSVDSPMCEDEEEAVMMTDDARMSVENTSGSIMAAHVISEPSDDLKTNVVASPSHNETNQVGELSDDDNSDLSSGVKCDEGGGFKPSGCPAMSVDSGLSAATSCATQVELQAKYAKRLRFSGPQCLSVL